MLFPQRRGPQQCLVEGAKAPSALPPAQPVAVATIGDAQIADPAPELQTAEPAGATASALSDTGAKVSAAAALSGDLAAWADEAGWPSATRGVLACLVHRESRGQGPTAHNGNAATGDDSWGLLQINLFGNLLPGRLELLRSLGYEVYTRDEAAAVLVQPVPNLRMGLLLSGGGWSFGPWAWACGGG